MDKRKWMARVFLALALVLSHVTVGVGAWGYVDLYWAGMYRGAGAPAWVGLLSALPFAAGCLVCLGLWVLCGRKRAG